MCMEDIRIGRKSQTWGKAYAGLASGLPVMIAERAEKRIALIISAEVNITLAVNQIGADVPDRHIFLAARTPLKLDVQKDGAIVMGTITAWGNADDQFIGVVETFLDME